MELMVVVAIIIVVAGIGIPSFIRYLPTIRLNGAARELMTDIMVLRMQAVKQATNARVTYLGNGDFKLWVDLDKDGSEDPDEVSTKSIRSGFSDVSVTYASTIQYNSRASCPYWGFIRLENPKGTRWVIVNMSGQVKIYRTNQVTS